jgi:hypothetical protein
MMELEHVDTSLIQEGVTVMSHKCVCIAYIGQLCEILTRGENFI